MRRGPIESLDALLAPRSVCVLPRRRQREPRVAVGPGCRVLDSGPVDLAIMIGKARIPAQASAALIVHGERSGSAPQSSALVLGPGAGLWTRGLRAGIAGAGKPARGRGWLLLCQGCGLAEQVLRAAAARGLPIEAAVVTGTGGPVLLRLARKAAELRPGVRLLLALHRPCAFEDWLSFGLQRPAAALLVTDTAEPLTRVPAAPRATSPSASQLARSVGLPVTRSPEELVAAAALLDAGLRRVSGLVLGLAPRTDEAALLADSLGRAGLRRGGGAPVAAVVRARRPSSRRAGSAPDATVIVDASGQAPRITPRGSRESLLADTASLRALAAVLEPAAIEDAGAAAGRPPARAASRRACLLLDGWWAELSEIEVKRLLALYGIRSPDERLATSASAAAGAAAELGQPVAVKPVGPALDRRAERGLLRLGVQSGAAVRQAFRDVLDGCAGLRPAPEVTGVLVSRMIPLPFALEVSLLWPAGTPPVLIAARRREDDEVVALPCPAGPDRAGWASDRLLGARSSVKARERLGEWLSRLSAIAPDLSGRLRWVHLDTVSPPGATDPPLVIDAAALQTASLRDPQGVRGGEPIEG